MKLSGRMTRSTDECEMSRSCHSATFSSAAIALRANQARQPGDLLAADRVALVRHRGRALLPARERLLDLADLGLLQAANLERELLERRRQDRQRGHQLGVAIALDDLRRDGRGRQPEPARRRPPRSTDPGARTCRPRPTVLPTAIVSRARTRRARSRCDLGVPERQLDAERHRLGVHAVRAADHRRAAVLLGARARWRAAGRRRPRRIRSHASRICSASAVSSTSEDVRPKCSQRAAGPDAARPRPS